MTSFVPLARALAAADVRYLMIGVTAANFHAHQAGVVFSTQDRDLFLPPEPENLVRAWQAAESCGLELWSGDEPLDRPRDLQLARWVVEQRGLTRATDQADLQVDLTLVMKGFTFEEAWRERRQFGLAGLQLPVARLKHIVTSKAAVGRLKDQLFLATHAEALQELLGPGLREVRHRRDRDR